MSDEILFAVLDMPPKLWDGSALDVLQRHRRYVAAGKRIRDDANKIARLEAENKSLIEVAEFAKGLVDKLEAECAALKLKDLHKIANDVCRDLPEDFEIRIVLEHHAGWVELCGPDGELVDLPDPTERTMDQQTYDALFSAMQAGEKP